MARPENHRDPPGLPDHGAACADHVAHEIRLDRRGPRNDSEDPAGLRRDHQRCQTMTGESALGRISCQMIHRLVWPVTMAAWTYSRLPKTAPRRALSRATGGQLTMAIEATIE